MEWIVDKFKSGVNKEVEVEYREYGPHILQGRYYLYAYLRVKADGEIVWVESDAVPLPLTKRETELQEKAEELIDELHEIIEEKGFDPEEYSERRKLGNGFIEIIRRP